MFIQLYPSLCLSSLAVQTDTVQTNTVQSQVQAVWGTANIL